MRSHPLALPHDPGVDLLADGLREAVARHWLHRAASERSVAVAFELLRPRLRQVGAIPPVVALIDKAIDDERRHGDLCVRLAARYRGGAVPDPSPRAAALPDFGTGDERLEVALTVMGMCCINESIASEWIRACWRAATAPIALAANKAHLEDEIDHARLGWAHLASEGVGAELKRKLGAWLPRLVRANVAEWKRKDEHLPDEGLPAHGHLDVRAHAETIDAAVRGVVLPGFAHVGVG